MMNKKILTMLLPIVSIVFTSTLAAAISNTPLPVSKAVKPQVMMVMSNDHQMFFKAYTDWDDLDEDGNPDTTYKNTIDYYGYFDSYKCYSYDSALGRFSPKSVTEDKYCHAVSGDWSGNFLNWATMTRMDAMRKVWYGGKRSTDTDALTVLERAHLPTDAHSFTKFYDGADLNQLTPFSYSSITLCNTTYDTSGYSHNSTKPPLMRAVKGDFKFWSANERWQCTWDNEHGDNSNGIHSDPNKSSDGIGDKDYTVRVEVCNASLLGTEKCLQYPDGNHKPIGVLHTYGEDGDIEFGLMTGSYAKNKSGGMLRKNVSSFESEVHTDTDGRFTNVDGIVKTLNTFRVVRYKYSDGTYFSWNSSNDCRWGLTSFTDGWCSNWGNPLGEMYLESIRYFSGQSQTSLFDGNDANYLNNLTKASWQDPLDNTKWCTTTSVILVNSSDISYDNDALITTGLNNFSSVKDWTNKVGNQEGITGNKYFVGENGVTNNQLCTPKTVTALGDVEGICPGSARLDGTYQTAGIAYWAHTNDIRSDLQGEQNIRTYSVAVSPNLPVVNIPVPNQDGKMVKLLPACRNASFNPQGNCALVDVKILAQDIASGTGKIFVNWEDSEQGGDYDQDMQGTISYSISGNQITVTTKVNGQSTPYKMGLAYIISGTTKDGFHVHSGINGFSYADIDPSVNDCGSCNSSDAASSETYVIGSSSAGNLKNPLWYAAKYGSFNDFDDNDQPTGASEWDEDNDGVPDNYFETKNFAKLENALEETFADVIERSASSSAVVANSVRVESGTKVYQAIYNTANWSGDLIAYPVTTSKIKKATWNAAKKLNSLGQSKRVILTYNPDSNKGVPFNWGDLTSVSGGQRDQLKTNPTTGTIESNAIAKQRLKYIRGARGKEQKKGGEFRDRDSKLGDITHSSPFYVGAPPFFYDDDFADASYAAFKKAHANRAPMIYVGANDGMLHAFNADTGVEAMAFIPNEVFPHLTQLTSPSYKHRYYVDGNPTVGDVYYSNAWKSVLVSGLRGGGQGMFALDVTDPSAFSEANASSIVLWEFTDATDADLGYTFAQPAIVKMNNNQWAAVFGNGYYNTEADGFVSTSGHGVLFIVFIEEGIDGSWSAGDYIKIDTKVGVTSAPNGLTTVAPADDNGDGKPDSIYAGDLYGNVWKFDVSSVNTADWSVAFGTTASPKPLFTATDANGTPQPITARPEVGRHPEGGNMIYVGTGKYFETEDNNPANSGTQSFYGIRDEGIGELKPVNLIAQSIVSTTSKNGYNLRSSTNYSVNYDTKFGWYMDMPAPGERIVSAATLRGGNIIFVTTVPSEIPCDFGGSSWLMELDAITGARFDEPVFDINKDKKFTNSDMVAVESGNSVQDLAPSGMESKEGIITRPSILSAGETEVKLSSGSTGNLNMVTERPSLGQAGRKSWRQVMDVSKTQTAIISDIEKAEQQSANQDMIFEQ